jgi:polyphosphate glucokinase
VDVLVIDIGGTHVKLLATGQDEPVKFVSGPKLTPRQMVAGVKSPARPRLVRNRKGIAS